MEQSFAQRNVFLDGMLGLAVGDALGVPFEARTREELRQAPAVDMVGYGSHRQPAGTWSDDTSMALCIADSLCRRFDPDDMMRKFVAWKNRKKYTATGVRFDIGRQTRRALVRYENGLEAGYCGDASLDGNGNGGLMRTLPMSLYQVFRLGAQDEQIEAVLEGVHEVSSLTHAHEYGLICCGLFTMLLREWLFFRRENEPLAQVCGRSFEKAMEVYERMGGRFAAAVHVPGLFVHPKKLMGYPEKEIGSTGYAVHTWHAALWCLMTTGDYASAVLKAVNLGVDTDTTAAVTGALAGVIYGREAIPAAWLDRLQARGMLEDISTRLNCAVFPERSVQDEIAVFTGEYSFLALKAQAVIRLDGLCYGNTQAAWLARSVAEEMRPQFTMCTAHQARRLARTLGQREDWEQTKEEELYRVCAARFRQNADMARRLMATGGHAIVYDTTGSHDNDLGRCQCRDCAQREAHNAYGRILMRIREELGADREN